MEESLREKEVSSVMVTTNLCKGRVLSSGCQPGPLDLPISILNGARNRVKPPCTYSYSP